MTFDEVAGLVSYNPQTGEFRWACKGLAGRRFGDICGSRDKRGYSVLNLNRQKFFAHRVAWLITYGLWPDGEIDHINCDPSDNRISNLRLATRSQNNTNVRLLKSNTSGVKGVCFDKSRGKWLATLQFAGRHHNLGRFSTKNEAAAVRIAAALSFHGPFARIS